VSIIGIGITTAVVSDIADMFGCLIGIPDIVTAITFVALGTSMPDLFASTTAAVGDMTADASVVNVTGSNSVNVFLGLGIPWTCASIYWTFFAERDAAWEDRYPTIANNPDYDGKTVFVAESRNLGFCVMVFAGLCTVAIMLLVIRRVCLGAELGGPKVPKYLSATLLIWLWVVFIYVCSWRVLACEKQYEKSDFNDVLCGKSEAEAAVIAVGTALVTIILCATTFTSILRNKTKAREAAIEYLEKVHTPECQDMAVAIRKQSGQLRASRHGDESSDPSEGRSNSKEIRSNSKEMRSNSKEKPQTDGKGEENEAEAAAERASSKEASLAVAALEESLEVWV
jgi:hypothetical protein